MTHLSKILCMDIYIDTFIHIYTKIGKRKICRDDSLTVAESLKERIGQLTCAKRTIQGRHTQKNHWFLRKTHFPKAFLNTINSLKGRLNCGWFRQSCKWQNMKYGKRGDYGEKRKAQEHFGEYKKQSTEAGWAAFFLEPN